MVDEFKSIRGSLLKAVMTTLKESSVSVKGVLDDDYDEHEDYDDDRAANNPLDSRLIKELLGGVFAKAGKSKDEIVSIVAREIGMSVAAAIKEPLRMLAEHQRLQITFEFVDKNSEDDAALLRQN